MTIQSALIPEGLSNGAFERLSYHVRSTDGKSAEDLLQRARKHLESIRQQGSANPFLNVRLAEAICDRLHSVVVHWERHPDHARPWLKAAMAYFSDSMDELSDEHSPIGFEDDCEVLNACLRLAGRDDLCIDPADFDDF